MHSRNINHNYIISSVCTCRLIDYDIWVERISAKLTWLPLAEWKVLIWMKFHVCFMLEHNLHAEQSIIIRFISFIYTNEHNYFFELSSLPTDEINFHLVNTIPIKIRFNSATMVKREENTKQKAAQNAQDGWLFFYPHADYGHIGLFNRHTFFRHPFSINICRSCWIFTWNLFLFLRFQAVRSAHCVFFRLSDSQLREIIAAVFSAHFALVIDSHQKCIKRLISNSICSSLHQSYAD